MSLAKLRNAITVPIALLLGRQSRDQCLREWPRLRELLQRELVATRVFRSGGPTTLAGQVDCGRCEGVDIRR